MMRNPDRIPPILDLLALAWQKVPDWRLGQLFENIKRYSGKNDLFYVEDKEFMQLIIDYFDLDNTSVIGSVEDAYNFEVGM